MIAPHAALEGEVLAPSRAAVLVNTSPLKRGARKIVILPEGATIADAIVLAGVGPRLARHVEVYLADHKIESRHWRRIRPKPGASLYMRLAIRGGDSGKDLVRTVLMIAIVVIGAMFNPFGAGTLAAALFNVGVSVAATMLVNALIPPPQAKKDPWRFDQQAGNPYASITGFRNQFAPYGPIPRVMGQKRMYPMLAARPYTETHGKTQWLRLALLVGYGPIDVSDIRIGQTPITAFPGAQWEVREGWPTDTPLSLYSTRIREEQFTTLLLYNQYTTKVTEVDTEEVSLDVSFPFGLISIDPDNGKTSSVTVTIDVEWSVNGSVWNKADWISPDGGLGTGTDGVMTAVDRTREATVRSGRFKVSGAANGQYQVRLRRTSGDHPSYVIDDPYWTTLRSVRSGNPVAMTGLTLIGLRLQATNQLNGVPDIVNCIASAYHEVYDSSTQTWAYRLTRNPAWQATDLLRKRGAVTICEDARIDLDAFSAWAAANDAPAPNAQENRWTCDGVLEGGSIASAVQLIAASGRAALTIGSAGKYTIVRDDEQTVPVAHISPRNSHSYRGSKTFADLPHALRVTYSNPDANDAQDEIIVYRDAYNEDGSGGKFAATKYETIDFPFCRSAKQAWREARYHLAVLELRPEEHVVSQDIEALSCTKGSFVRFSYDTVSIGLGQGRIVALVTSGANVTGIKLDGQVEMADDLNYGVRIRHADLSTSVHTIVYQAGLVDTLTFTTPAAIEGGPAVGDLAMFGEAGIETAPMLVKQIRRGDNLTAQLTLVDAQPGVWTADSGTIPAFQSYINRSAPVSASERPAKPVLNVRSDETVMQRLGDGTLLERIELRLDNYASLLVPAVRWEAQYRAAGINGENWRAAGAGPLDAALYIIGEPAGESLDFRARAISEDRVPSEWTYVFEHLVIGKTTAPAAPTSFAITATVEGVRVSFTPSTSVDVVEYEVRAGGSDWASASLVDAHCAGSPRLYTYALSGSAVTFRIKAIDAGGLYSTEVTASSPANNGAPAYAGNAAALAALGPGQLFTDTSDGNKIKTTILDAAALTVTLNRYSQAKTRSGAGTVTSDSYTATVSGGSGNYEYTWSQYAGDTLTSISSPTGSSTTFTHTLIVGETRTAKIQLTVRDTTNEAKSAIVLCTFRGTETT